MFGSKRERAGHESQCDVHVRLFVPHVLCTPNFLYFHPCARFAFCRMLSRVDDDSQKRRRKKKGKYWVLFVHFLFTHCDVRFSHDTLFSLLLLTLHKKDFDSDADNWSEPKPRSSSRAASEVLCSCASQRCCRANSSLTMYQPRSYGVPMIACKGCDRPEGDGGSLLLCDRYESEKR